MNIRRAEKSDVEIFSEYDKHISKEEMESKVKLAAKTLYQTLMEKKNQLFVVGWEKDDQPKEKVRSEIMAVLNQFLPESYDREVFSNKTNLIFTHIVDQAIMGLHWVA